MKLIQLLQDSLSDWNRISGLSFALYDISDQLFLTVGNPILPKDESLSDFRESQDQLRSGTDFTFQKIADDSENIWLLVISGRNQIESTIVQLAACQVKSLLIAGQEKQDKNSFLQNLVLEKYSETEAYNLARKFHLSLEISRYIFLIDTGKNTGNDRLTMIRNIFGSHTRDLITAIDNKDILILHESASSETPEDITGLADMLVDMLNTEAMTSARVSISSVCENLADLPNAYREARTAMEIGKIFYAEQNVFAYDRLGIGRIIYQLPVSVCEMFLKESFSNELPDTLDEETLNTIRTFFENNLNLAETSRQLYVHRNTLVYRFERLQKKLGLDVRTFEDAITFKIAMMVSDYLKTRKGDA